jgi:predicted phage baseplate assembly protein
MPLDTFAPKLDDRSFDQIVAEAKSLIPRYAPEWTDYNESDPGITLVQLFAWMTEMTLYRLNQVPDLNYIKFLQLIGIELTPARPATAELTFTLARKDVDTVIVPKATQVAAQNDAGGPPIIFETDDALIALGAALKAIQSFDGFSYNIETTKNNAAGQWFYPFGPRSRDGSALVLGFDSPLPFTSQQINLAVRLFQDGRTPNTQRCDADLSTIPLPASVQWEYWDGQRWQAMGLDKDETRSFSYSGHILLRGPGAKAKKDKLGEVTDKLYWIRCRLVHGTYELAPRIATLLTNTIGATQAVTLHDEVLGGSDGQPNQTFTLANTPVIVRDPPDQASSPNGPVSIRTVRLEVSEVKDEYIAWQEVDDFLNSASDDPHFTLNRATGEIHFGDGKHGRIPVANPDHPDDSVIAREYRYGGGKAANVGATTINQLQTFVRDVDKVTNLLAAQGGTDEETLAAAQARAPREIKSKDRAVTVEDFETLALASPGANVLRAKALPLANPRFPGEQIPGAISVIVVPDSDAPNPMPNETTLAAVCAYLNQHRLLTSEVYVVPPKYHLVRIEADIIVQRQADLAEVSNALHEKLLNYLNPLKGGPDGTGWEFGRDIFYSDIYRIILEDAGVDRIRNNQLVIWLDGQRNDFCRDVAIEDGALVYSTDHDLRLTYA